MCMEEVLIPAVRSICISGFSDIWDNADSDKSCIACVWNRIYHIHRCGLPVPVCGMSVWHASVGSDDYCNASAQKAIDRRLSGQWYHSWTSPTMRTIDQKG